MEQNTKSGSQTAIGTHLQDSLSPSKSMVEIVIHNVTCAGYLSLAQTADQTPSQQGVNATTNSRKQTQKEMEQESNGKQMKKHAKITVPAHE